MAIPGPPTQTLATMIFDGVLERHPALRIGVIEQGAIWMPCWMRQMESALDAFVRHEERLQSLSLRPREYVRRQIKADRTSTRLNSSPSCPTRMPSSACKKN